MRRFVLRLLNACFPHRSEREVAREIESHLALLEDDFKRQGLSETEARRAARLALGGAEQAKEMHREARSFGWMDDIRRDLRYALRTLAKSPAFTSAVILILAVGIGANTAMFSVLNGVVLKPLVYPDPERIVAVLNRWTDTGLTGNLTGADEIDIRSRKDIFESFAYYHGGEIGVKFSDHSEFVGTQLVHPDFFRVFGLSPVAGRLFNPSDAQQSVIVSLGFAERNFGSAPGSLGQSVFIENRAYEIVGVMPPQMRFPANTDVWTADSLEPQNRNRSGHNYRAVAKLAHGVSLETANAKLSALALQLASVYPETNSRKTFVTVPMRDNLVSRVRSTLFVMMAAVAFVLLIACANVANLMLARSSARSREIAIRVALGAKRRHLIGQLLVESLLLAVAAGVIGLAIARLGTSALLGMGSRYVPVPRLEDVQLDWSVLIFAAIVSMMTAIIFGLVPVQELSRLGIRDALNQAGSRGHVGVGSSRMRNILVVTQIALSFVLAINAGLLMRSFFVLTNVPLGFRSDHVLVAYAHAPAEGSIFKQSGLENYLRVGRELDDLVARIEHLPGVVSAGAVMGLPTGQYNSDGSYVVEGKNSFSGDPRVLPHAGFRLSGPGYFTTMRIPLLRGRDFDGTDIYGRQPVAIISAALARQSFGDEDPIGHKVMWGFDLPIQWATIVGIVGDVRQASPAASIEAQLYMPLRQHPYAANEIQIVLRSGRTPELLIPDIRETARAVNPSIATKFIAMEDSVAESIAAPRFRMTLVGAFASIALLLAATGMYAVLSYTTTQRIPEFAVRRALGAQARTIVGLVLRQAARLSAIGVMIGLVLVLATHRVIAAMLFGIDTSDIATYAGVLLATLPIVMIAAALPALRAARVDPAATLRMD